jgi:hypothetical protein
MAGYFPDAHDTTGGTAFCAMPPVLYAASGI